MLSGPDFGSAVTVMAKAEVETSRAGKMAAVKRVMTFPLGDPESDQAGPSYRPVVRV
jgi:hypothetical protein